MTDQQDKLYSELKGSGLYINYRDEVLYKAIDILQQLKGMTVAEIRIICKIVNSVTESEAIL